MATTITPGFTGYALCNGKYLRFATSSLNATQEVEAPDMVMGDYTHNAWAYGKIEVGGTISGPMTENSMDFIDEIWGGGRTIDIKYYGGFTRRFTDMYVNTFTINVRAGEVVDFSADFIGKGFSLSGASALEGVNYTIAEKLLTWDKCSLYVSSTTGGSWTDPTSIIDHLQSFSITLSNNITRQFAIQASNLYGNLVRGMSAVTGNMVNYELKSAENAQGNFSGSGAEYWNAYAGTDYHQILFRPGDSHLVKCTIVFHRATSELSVGPVLTTTGFTGIGHWGGDNPFDPTHDAIS
jgi:hypothetical protein